MPGEKNGTEREKGLFPIWNIMIVIWKCIVYLHNRRVAMRMTTAVRMAALTMIAASDGGLSSGTWYSASSTCVSHGRIMRTATHLSRKYGVLVCNFFCVGARRMWFTHLFFFRNLKGGKEKAQKFPLFEESEKPLLKTVHLPLDIKVVFFFSSPPETQLFCLVFIKFTKRTNLAGPKSHTSTERRSWPPSYFYSFLPLPAVTVAHFPLNA